MNTEGVSFIVSYDGRTSDKIFGKPLPAFLNLHLVEICAGRSSQSTLSGRDDITYESLYISPALIKRLSNSVPLRREAAKLSRMEASL